MQLVLKFTIILSVLMSVVIDASEVIQVSASRKYLLVTPDIEPNFKVANYVCVVEDRIELVCGFISVVTSRGAVLHLERRDKRVDVGAAVEYAINTEASTPFADISELQDVEDSVPLYQVLFGHGPQVKHVDPDPKYSLFTELNFTNPSVLLESEMEPKLTWSLQLSRNQFSSLNANVPQAISGTLVGLIIDFNYYTRQSFQGLWFRAGAGYYCGTVSYKNYSDNLGTLSVTASVGYRWMKKSLVFGTLVGTQYFNIAQNSNFPYKVNLFSPLLAVNLGWTF